MRPAADVPPLPRLAEDVRLRAWRLLYPGAGHLALSPLRRRLVPLDVRSCLQASGAEEELQAFRAANWLERPGQCVLDSRGQATLWPAKWPNSRLTVLCPDLEVMSLCRCRSRRTEPRKVTVPRTTITRLLRGKALKMSRQPCLRPVPFHFVHRSYQWTGRLGCAASGSESEWSL